MSKGTLSVFLLSSTDVSPKSGALTGGRELNIWTTHFTAVGRGALPSAAIDVDSAGTTAAVPTAVWLNGHSPMALKADLISLGMKTLLYAMPIGKIIESLSTVPPSSSHFEQMSPKGPEVCECCVGGSI